MAAYAPTTPTPDRGARSMRKPISDVPGSDPADQLAGSAMLTGVPSVQLTVNEPAGLVTGFGVAGSARFVASVTGRIMSISSWLSMWQCHTYSQPKSTTVFTIGLMGLPSASVLLNPASLPVGPATEPCAPSGSAGLRRRLLSGIPNGRVGLIGRTAT